MAVFVFEYNTHFFNCIAVSFTFATGVLGHKTNAWGIYHVAFGEQIIFFRPVRWMGLSVEITVGENPDRIPFQKAIAAIAVNKIDRTKPEMV